LSRLHPILIEKEGNLAANRLIHLFWHLSYSPRRCRCVQIGLSWEKGVWGEIRARSTRKFWKKCVLKKMGKSEQAGSPKFFGGKFFLGQSEQAQPKKFRGKSVFLGKSVWAPTG